uniref:Uncharacterized protein n=1 Tax=Romanomermis culicivorax TaxID=13658 RepID=A0A915IT35_ROMCU
HREVFDKPEADWSFSAQTLDDFCQSIVETIEENQRWSAGSANQVETLRNKIQTYWNCLLKEFFKTMFAAYGENANIGTEIDSGKLSG